jgi:hypothetical protein
MEPKPRLQKKIQSLTLENPTAHRETNSDNISDYALPRDVPLLLKDETNQQSFDAENKFFKPVVAELRAKLSRIHLSESSSDITASTTTEPVLIKPSSLPGRLFDP